MNSQTDKIIEDALRTYPLADVPPNFSKRVMSRVRTMPASPPFRLTWMDYALAFFLTLLVTVGFAIWFFLPRQALLQLQFQWQLFQASSIQPVVAVSLVVAGLFLLLALLFSLNFLFRPKLVAR
jgi:hypothetical protein